MRTRIRPALTALWTTVLVAIAANLLVLLGGVAANGGPVIVEQPGTSIEVAPPLVVAASIIGAVIAAIGALVAVLLFCGRALTVFVIGASALTLLSLLGTLQAATPTAVATLMIMHLVTGTVGVIGNAVIHDRAARRSGSEARAPQPTR